MKELNSKGSSIIYLLLTIFLFVLIVGIGYYVYNSQKKTDIMLENNSNSKVDSQRKQKSDGETLNTAENNGYLVIKEWDIKFRVDEAAKVTYEYDGKPGEGRDGPYESQIFFKVKPQFLKDKSCNISVGMTRNKEVDDFFKDAPKIGDYYYLGNGSPYNCGNDQDNTLNSKIRQDLGYPVAL